MAVLWGWLLAVCSAFCPNHRVDKLAFDLRVAYEEVALRLYLEKAFEAAEARFDKAQAEFERDVPPPPPKKP